MILIILGMLPYPFPGELLCPGDLGRGHFLGHKITITDCHCRAGNVVPHMRLYIVLRDTVASVVHKA